ncbi:MAG: zinc-ribbon domain-containing protein [Blastocatellales bacterium]
MFCPKCGAQNKIEQKFCRNCGQSLPAVRMALEGRIDEAVATLEKDFDKLSSGVVTLVIFTIIALAISFFSFGSTTINLMLGLLIAGPMIYKGIKRLKSSIALLDQKELAQVKKDSSPAPIKLEQGDYSNAALPPVPDTDPILRAPIPVSITEETTHKLKQPNE